MSTKKSNKTTKKPKTKKISTEEEEPQPADISSYYFAFIFLASFLVITWMYLSQGGQVKMPSAVVHHLQRGVFVPVWHRGNVMQVFLRIEGPADGERVLLMHGLPVSSFVYRNVIDVLVGKGFRVIAFDFPGMGLSDKPEGFDYSTRELTEITNSVLDAINVEQVHLVVQGISGSVGADLAMEYPERIRSFTIANAVLDLENFEMPFPMSLFEMESARSYFFRFITSSNIISDVCSYVLQVFTTASSITFEDAAAHVYLLGYNKGENSFFSILDSMTTTQKFSNDLRESLKNAEYPFQMITVAHDILPQSQQEYVRKNSQLTHNIILESFHFPQEDQPEEFANVIAQFVQEQDPTPNLPKRPEIYHAHGGHDHSHSHTSHDHSHSHNHEEHTEQGGHDHSHNHDHEEHTEQGGHDHAHSHESPSSPNHNTHPHTH